MTSSTRCSTKKSRIATSRASTDEKPFCDSSARGMPRSRAKAAPAHEGRLVATATTSNPRSTRLRRLVPWPETQTPNLIGEASADDHPVGAGRLHHLADHVDVPRGISIAHQDH